MWLQSEWGLCVQTKRLLRLYMNEVSGKCLVNLSLSGSCVVWAHQPQWRWSLYRRYFPFWRQCVTTCHWPTAGSLRGTNISAHQQWASNMKQLLSASLITCLNAAFLLLTHRPKCGDRISSGPAAVAMTSFHGDNVWIWGLSVLWWATELQSTFTAVVLGTQCQEHHAVLFCSANSSHVYPWCPEIHKE